MLVLLRLVLPVFAIERAHLKGTESQVESAVFRGVDRIETPPPTCNAVATSRGVAPRARRARSSRSTDTQGVADSARELASSGADAGCG
jgi:hypothetical protein